jgi:hypothetical protein
MRSPNPKIDLSSALNRLVHSLESHDVLLFDSVTLSHSPSGSTPSTRRSTEKRPKPGLHTSASRPLPSLAEDKDTQQLRSQVNSLENELNLLDIDIALVEKQIASLQAQRDVLSSLGQNPSVGQESPRRVASVRRQRAETPAGIAPEERTQYWKRKRDETKGKLEALKRVLEHGKKGDLEGK